MTNRLIEETSPYLLQHAGNPVDWYPWGQEAFEKARREDKPVFLSVGYSACHWCHVMEHESFENEATAALLNREYVAVKVDREERPDVDAIYMSAVQALTGQGGWPMSVFMTPEGVPFYGGTYFPDRPRYGTPSFTQVLTQLALAWKERRDEVMSSGASVTRALQRDVTGGAGSAAGGAAGELRADALDAAVRSLELSFDRIHGGFEAAPKFPQPMVLEFLLRRHVATRDEHPLAMVTATLDAMMKGGIYDQLGGGFHRYAVDDVWLVPHFEKMLYDNAQLAGAYLRAWQVTGEPGYRRVVRETLDYVLREMTDPSGGFYSAQDADSEGEEGRFFVWTPAQIEGALGASPEDLGLFAEAHGVTPQGNWEGKTILTAARDAEQLAAARSAPAGEIAARLAAMRAALFAAREARVRPGLDDKVLASWNGLMLAVFAEAARGLDDDAYLRAARANAAFLLEQMRAADGRMLRTWKGGRARLNGYLEDHAAVAGGLLQLYQTDFDERWFGAARELADLALTHFEDPRGGFYDTSDDHERLLTRPKGLQDGAQPSGGSLMASVLLELAAYTGEGRYAEAAERALAPLQPAMAQVPLGFANWLNGLDLALAPPREVALVGDDLEALLAAVRRTYRPSVVVAACGSAGTATSTVPLLQGREAVDGAATAYVCTGTTCSRPVAGPEELEAQLEG